MDQHFVHSVIKQKMEIAELFLHYLNECGCVVVFVLLGHSVIYPEYGRKTKN